MSKQKIQGVATLIIEIIKEHLASLLDKSLPIAVQAIRGEATAIRIVIPPNSKVIIHTDLAGNEWIQQPFSFIFRTKTTNDNEHLQALNQLANIGQSLTAFNGTDRNAYQQIEYRVLQEAYLPMPVSSGSYADYHISMRCDYIYNQFYVKGVNK